MSATGGKGHTHKKQHTKRTVDDAIAYIVPRVVETRPNGKRIITSVGKVTKNNGVNYNITTIKDGLTVLGNCNWTKGRNRETLKVGDYVLIEVDEEMRMMNGVPIIMKYSDSDILKLEEDGHLKQQSVQSKVVSIQDDKESELTFEELKDKL